MPKVIMTKSELNALFGGQEVVLLDGDAVYVKPVEVKQKLGIPNNLELEVVEDPAPTPRSIGEASNPFED
jgi:hypothetical protein